MAIGFRIGQDMTDSHQEHMCNGNQTIRMTMDSSPNLAPDPGFENGGGWTESRVPEFAGTAIYSSNWGTAAPHSGGYAYSISNHAYGYLESDLITIRSNTQYDLYAYVRGELDINDSEGGGWLIRAYFYDSSNNLISYVDAASGGAGTLNPSWQYVGGRVTTPGTAAKLRIQLYDYLSSGWVAFDDVELYKIVSGNRNGSNLASDPGFENGGTWSENRNTPFPGTSFYRTSWGTASPHTGSYAYAISNQAYGSLHTGYITVQPNAQYDLYTYVRGELDAGDSGGGWLVRAYFYDSNNNYISYADAASGEAGTLNTNWQMVGSRIIAPANAAKMIIDLIDYMNSGWVAFDDISLKLVGNYQLSYDAENRLVGVSGAVTASFVYDGDGNRVKGTIGTSPTMTYIGNYLEWTDNTSTMIKYYYAGSTRVAMRTGSSTLNYLLGDHLGSQAITTSSSGAMSAEIRYYPWGTERYSSGTTPTTYHFTGQRLESSLGLYYYGARWYDPTTGRFIQADTLIPVGVQGLDRYAYVMNNPLNYTDSNGHHYCDSKYEAEDVCDWYNKADPKDEVCRADRECYQAYLTYNELIFQLGRIPSVDEILYMTAQTEGYSNKDRAYHGSGTYSGNFTEALARNYYQPEMACIRESSTCTGSKLYKFMSGYQVWFGGSQTPYQRATNLISSGLNNDTYRSDLEADIANILDPVYAQLSGWDQGLVPNVPWQWHNWIRPPNSGEALGWIYLPNPNGNYFWIMTIDQTEYFQHEIEHK